MESLSREEEGIVHLARQDHLAIVAVAAKSIFATAKNKEIHVFAEAMVQEGLAEMEMTRQDAEGTPYQAINDAFIEANQQNFARRANIILEGGAIRITGIVYQSPYPELEPEPEPEPLSLWERIFGR